MRKRQNITQDEFATKLGIKRSLVGAWEEDRSEPRATVLTRIAALFSITVEALVLQDLAALPESQWANATLPDVEGKGTRVLMVPVKEEDRDQEMIPVVPITARAGYTTGYADPEFIQMLPVFSLPVPEIHKFRTYRVFQIAGDSMLPLQPGTYIIGEYTNNWREIRNGDAYIIVTREDGVVYKRVIKGESPADPLLLVSDNTDYEPYNVAPGEVREVWKSTGFISFALPKEKN
jgi:transcriptional regulator with XRE-family HTH domain